MQRCPALVAESVRSAIGFPACGTDRLLLYRDRSGHSDASNFTAKLKYDHAAIRLQREPGRVVELLVALTARNGDSCIVHGRHIELAHILSVSIIDGKSSFAPFLRLGHAAPDAKAAALRAFVPAHECRTYTLPSTRARY